MAEPKTAVQKFWLWGRPVSIVFAGCSACCVVLTLISLINIFFTHGRWYFGVPALMALVSIVIGTIWYIIDRARYPNHYR